MSDKLKAADAMARKLNFFLHSATHTDLYAELSAALAAYEAAPAESQAAGEDEQRAKDSAHFHAWYLSGTAKPPKYPDPEYIWHAAMNQGRKQSAEQLAAAQARIAKLTEFNKYVAEKLTTHAEAVGVSPDHFDYIDETTKAIIAMWAKNSELIARVAVLEKALEGAMDAFIKYEMDVEDSPPYHHRQLMERINAALAAQPSREKEGDK